ncbi:MAG TPA: hypothetical protein PK955_08305 [Methanoregulaceae archaeon]|nr:hypothetical protein [Methanoregulaceae archaeon]
MGAKRFCLMVNYLEDSHRTEIDAGTASVAEDAIYIYLHQNSWRRAYFQNDLPCSGVICWRYIKFELISVSIPHLSCRKPGMLLSSPTGVKTGWLNSGKILWHNHGSGKAPGFDHFADRKMNDNLLSIPIGSFIAQLPGSHPSSE